jgi:hypothetical protein
MCFFSFVVHGGADANLLLAFIALVCFVVIVMSAGG